MISVVVPVYNEEKNIEPLHETLKATFLKMKEDHEIIFVDDGSTDRTLCVLGEMSAKRNVRCHHFEENLGKSAALQKGFGMAEGDIVVQVDGDNQYAVFGDIPRMVEKLRGGYDMVNGWRAQRYGPMTRRLVSKFYNIMCRNFFGLTVHDYNCGLKLYRAVVVKSFDLKKGDHRYLPAIAHLGNFRVTELDVMHLPRKFGGSKYGFWRIIEGFTSLIGVWWRYGRGRSDKD